MNHLASDMASEGIEAKTLTLKLKTTAFEVCLDTSASSCLLCLATQQANTWACLFCTLWVRANQCIDRVWLPESALCALRMALWRAAHAVLSCWICICVARSHVANGMLALFLGHATPTCNPAIWPFH